MVDVELINRCSDDITAYAIGLSDLTGSQPVRIAETSDLLNLLMFGEVGEPLDPYVPNDIFRRGKAIRLRLPVPSPAPIYLGEVSVTAVVFLGRTASGDGDVVRSILEVRKEYVEGLISAKSQLEAVGDLVSARMRFRNRAKSTIEEREARTVSTAERVARNELDQLGRYSEFARSDESWQSYVAGKSKKLNRMIDVYTQHSRLNTAE